MSTHHAQGHATVNNSRASGAQTSIMDKDKNDSVNRRDEFGFTSLHRAIAENNVDKVKALLSNPKLDINDKDLESGWTALHRALYFGNLRIALLLTQHKDIDTTIEDKDRNTAVDLCQATLPVSLPTPENDDLCPGDALYTWGSNSNFTLGHNDGDDRKIPELVKFPYQTNTITFPRAKSAKPILHQLSMSKFHTAIATSEPGFTGKVWGFGTNGRLGLDRKMQLCPAPVSGVSGNIVFTALGRDHTVYITNRGEVYTLGNNKYGQLGYVSEIPKNGQDPIQITPKRVILAIAKLMIVGAAASRWHTVVHTNTELYTFGFNYGQLGYERKGDIQMGPRKVASIPSGLILQVAASDSATACLMSSNDVIVFYKYAYHKVNFSLNPYPDWFSAANAYTIVNENRPEKISCSENKFGMMTKWGDIHVWSYPEVDASITLGSIPPNYSIPFSSITPPDKPRRVWTFGGDRTKAIDFAMGQNGSVIMLTRGGHVYIGTNKGSSIGRNVKWQRVAHLDRVVQVYANPSGAWAAFRSESTLTPVVVRRGCLASDLEQSLSQFHLYRNNEKNHGKSIETKAAGEDDDDDDDDQKVEVDPWRINTQGWQDIEKSWDFDVVPLLDLTTKTADHTGMTVSGSHLFDVELQAGKRVLGAHRIILAARSIVLHRAFVDTPRARTKVGSLVTIEPTKDGSTGRILYTILLDVEFTTAVLLLQFFYSDRFDSFWDALDLPKASKQYAFKVRQELYHLSLELSLPTLQGALQYSFTHVCSASLSKNMDQVLQDPVRFQKLADVRLLLKNGHSIDGHQMVLGHRSPFFNAMFVRTDEWVRARQGPRSLPGPGEESEDDILEIDMKHLDLESTALVMKYIYTDCGPEMFDSAEKDDMDDLIQLVINVLVIADELLMDRLKEICEKVLAEQVRAKTVATFLEISLMFAADSLKTTCIDYLCHNVEMMLDQRWLEGVDDDILMLVEESLKKKQDAFMPFVRSGGYLPDPKAVEEVQKLLKARDSYRYFTMAGLPRHEISRNPRQSHHREVEQGYSTIRPGSQTTAPEVSTSPSSSTTHPTEPTRSISVSSLPSETNATAVTDEHSSVGPKIKRTVSGSQSDGAATDWPVLSDAANMELKDIPSLPTKKTSWGQVASLESAQLIRDGQDSYALEGASSKPSLREILELEERQGQVGSNKPSTSTGSSGAPKAIKMSQKERRKILQQQQASSSPPDQTNPPLPSPPVWGKVASPNTLDLNLTGGPAGITTGTSAVTPSLLDIQQSELSLFRAQPKGVPRVAIATSKPVKETTRTGLTERTYSEAPWRLDAIPEPLRAVTRHQSQMYPKLESSSSYTHASSSGTSSSPSLGPTRSAHPSSSSGSNDPILGNGTITPALAATTPSNSGISSNSSTGSAMGGALPLPTPAPSSSSSSMATALSSFAIIQNQQLRDRNMLLRARHHKKSLYQIQIEEQALSQIRSMSLDRVRTKIAEGTGEWFTCEILERF
ncbi:hypothetical protein BGX21_006761 [Mortierella sp. AD011]|nr:hypothetical protein BGX20_006777 [Mortierella sp. AD010]KAF9399129.1 hypothetical protein BGX21_006761 [Mortierella sp. AD011]